MATVIIYLLSVSLFIVEVISKPEKHALNISIPKLESSYTASAYSSINSYKEDVHEFTENIEEGNVLFVLGYFKGAGIDISDAWRLSMEGLNDRLLVGLSRKIPNDLLKTLPLKKVDKNSIKHPQALHFTIESGFETQVDKVDWQKSLRFQIEIDPISNDSISPTLPINNAYRYIHHYDYVIPVSFVMGFLISNDIDVVRAWYSNGDSRCGSYEVMTPPSLVVQVRMNDNRMKNFNFEKVNGYSTSLCENIHITSYRPVINKP